jgi:hypothetical protein
MRLAAAPSRAGPAEPVTVEICPELAALGVAHPCQAIRARRRHRLLCRAQIFLPDDEGDHRVGVCSVRRRHHARQHRARRQVHHRHGLSRLDLQLAADIHALSMRLPSYRPQYPHETGERGAARKHPLPGVTVRKLSPAANEHKVG